MKKHLLKLCSFTLALCFAGAINAQEAAKVNPEVMAPATMDKVYYTGAEVIDAPQDAQDFRYPGVAIGRTFYDLQSNGSNQRRIVSHGNGELSAVWTMSLDEFDASFPGRGTGYNYWNGNEWGDFPTARLEGRRIGWPSVNVSSTGITTVVAHVSDPVFDNAGWVSRKEPGGSWVESPIISQVPQTTGLLWPRSVMDENDVLHAFALTTPVANMGAAYEGVDGHLLYYRSQDAGLNWDKFDVIVPGLDSSNYTAMGADAYALDANAGKVAFAHFDDWNDVSLYTSEDGGETWTRTLVNDFPLEKYVIDQGYTIDDIGGVDTLGPGGNPAADTAALKAIYTSDNAGSVVVDNDGKAHVFFGEMYVTDDVLTDGNSSYYPANNGLAYWNEDMAGERPITLTGALDVDGNGTLDIASTDDIALYFFSMSSMPNAVVDENNHLYLAYSAIMENYQSVDGQHYRHIYLMKSEDGGENWTDPLDVITKDLFDDDELFAFVEATFPTIAVDGKFLHLIYQQDYEPGLNVRGDMDPVFENEIVYLKFDKATLTLVEKVVRPEAFAMTLSPNPAEDIAQLSFDLKSEADINVALLSLDGKVISVQDQGTMNSGSHKTAFDVSDLASGMYLVKLTANNQAATMQLIVR